LYIDPKLNAGGAYLLTWNPTKWPHFDLGVSVRDFNKGRLGLFEWATGNTKTLQPGAPFFFLKQGTDDAGIAGWGRIRSQGFRKKHWDPTKRKAGEFSNEVLVTFDHLCTERDDRFLSRENLRSRLKSAAHCWDAQSSGIRLTAKVADGVRRLLLERQVRMPKLDDLPPVTQVSTAQFIEGAAKQVLVTRHERSKDAKSECLEHYGCVCQGCGFDFGLYYGPDADGMIEVHHLRPISQASKSYRVDPIKDLRPLCPNCHRVVHLPGAKKNPLTIPKLRAMVRRYGKRSSR
jgi:5-methylcytosine-specific restriction protein A